MEALREQGLARDDLEELGMNTRRAFTLNEMMVVVAFMIILAGLLVPALSRVHGSARRAECAANLRQVGVALRLYADDHADSLPVLESPNPYPNGVGAYYKQLVKGYLGLTGPASPAEGVFTCPSDPTIRRQVSHAFTSFTFSGYEAGPGDLPRITGKRLGSVRQPSKAVLVGEWTAFFGGSWHPLRTGPYPDSRSVLGFVDGHANYSRMYWDGMPGSRPSNYEPPAGYDYTWGGE